MISCVTRVLQTKDVISNGKMIQILLSILPFLNQKQEYHILLGTECLLNALQVLHDGHKKELHYEVIHFISESYYTNKEVSRESFLKIPGMTFESLNVFEQGLCGISILKERIIYTRSFLQKIIGKEDSQLFSMEPSFSLNLMEKKMLSKPLKDTLKYNILDSHEGPSLDSLFTS